MRKIFISFCFLISFSVLVFSQSKPLDISNAVLDLQNYQQKAARGQPNGYAPLDSNSLISGQFMFPGFNTAAQGTIWAKSGNGTFEPLSNSLSFSEGGITINKIKIGLIGAGYYGLAVAPGNSDPLVIGSGFSSGRVYILHGNEIGSANSNYTGFRWSIKSSGQFNLGTGAFSGDINLSGKNIIEVNEIQPTSPQPGLPQNGIRFKLAGSSPEIYSLGAGQTLWFRGSNFNLGINDVLDIDNDYQNKKSFALNISTADLRFAKLNETNSWPQTQSFNQIILTSPLSVEYGGLGVNLSTEEGKAEARQNLGIQNTQSYNVRLQQISDMTPPVDSFIVGTTGNGFAQKTKSETIQLLGLVPGQNVQTQSPLLQVISQSGNSTDSGVKYFYVLSGGGSPILQRRMASDARLDIGMSIIGSSLVASSSAASMQSILQLSPGTHVQPFNSILSQISSNTWSGSTSITTIGSISQGFWDATPIIPARGGTGLAQAPTQGQMLVGTSTGGYELTKNLTVNTLSVNSTAKVANLNADSVDGINFDNELNKTVNFVDGDSKVHTIVIQKGIIKSWNTAE